MSTRKLDAITSNSKNRSHLFSEPRLNGNYQQWGEAELWHAKDKPSEGRLSAPAEARSVSASLTRTKGMMKQELERLSYVSSKIDKDGYLLRDATEDHRSLGSVVKGARRTLGVLQRQDLKETVALWCAVSFFYVVVLFILWNRIGIPFFFVGW
jgi:hypothetical protein